MRNWRDSYHTTSKVIEEDGYLRTSWIDGGCRIDGPPSVHDRVRTGNGKFYRITDIVIKVVEDEPSS